MATTTSPSDLEARVRELEAQGTLMFRSLQIACERAEAAEQKLADANALLDKAIDAIDEACYPVWWEKWRAHIAAQPAAATQSNGAPPSAPTTGAAGRPATAESKMPVPAPVVPMAAQPAAPTTGCSNCGANTFEPHRGNCAGQPAAPSRTEAEHVSGVSQHPRNCRCPKHEAEQAVLDAMAEVPEENARAIVNSSQNLRGLPKAFAAELARRGLKP